MVPVLNLIIIYTRDLQRLADFYAKYFGYAIHGSAAGGLMELVGPEGGANILLHRTGKGVKLGQVAVKLTFCVQDVELFKETSAAMGLEFGSTHHGDGYSFANTKDPDGNSVSVSSRRLKS